MRLFIANVTRQRQVVNFRLDFINEGNAAQRSSGAKQITLEPGQQGTIGGDLDPNQAQLLMDQLSVYGGIGVEEINRLPKFRLAYILSYGKAIPTRIIQMVHEHNNNLLTVDGDVRRRNAAIAAHPLVEQQIDGLKRLDIEMLEVPPEAGEADPLGKPLDFGAHLERNARETNQPPPKARKRARR
jgi:hypothetical protein